MNPRVARGSIGGLDCEVILVTAFASADTALAAMKRGAYGPTDPSLDLWSLRVFAFN